MYSFLNVNRILTHHLKFEAVICLEKFITCKKVIKYTSDAKNIRFFIEIFFVYNFRSHIADSSWYIFFFLIKARLVSFTRNSIITHKNRRGFCVLTDYIFRFYISMNKTRFMNEMNIFQNLFHYFLKHLLSIIFWMVLNIVHQISTISFF